MKQLSMHLFPFFFALYEGWNATIEDTELAHIFFVIFTLFYYLFSLCMAYRKGKWQYKFLEDMPRQVRTVFFTGFIVFGLLNIEIFALLRKKAGREAMQYIL